jgi:hypothetical protein
MRTKWAVFLSRREMLSLLSVKKAVVMKYDTEEMLPMTAGDGYRSNDKKKYIFFFDYTTGGVFYYIYAHSKEAIEQVFPEMYVFETPPKRFTERDARSIEKHSATRIFDIDNLHGTLKDYLDNRQKDDYIFQNPHEKRPFVDDP